VPVNRFEFLNFNAIVDALWANRERINDGEGDFDYPDYGGIPRRLYDKLTPDFVDAVQMIAGPYEHEAWKSRKTLFKWLKEYLMGEIPDKFFPEAKSASSPKAKTKRRRK